MVLDLISEFFNVERGLILAPLAILMSALIGSSVAMWAILSNRSMARMKNSMDFVNGYNEDKDIAEALKEIKHIENKTSHEVEKMATHSGDLYEHAKHIMKLLNYYEAMALCIHRGIYSEVIIKEAVFTTVTDIWNLCQPYVIERRKIKRNTTYFQEMETLIARWNEPGNRLKSKCREKK